MNTTKNHSDDRNINIVLNSNELRIQGALAQETVVEAICKCEALLPSNKTMNVNFSTVSYCDSASLAFMTALLRLGKERNMTLTYIQVPQQIIDLAKVSGLDKILPIKE